MKISRSFFILACLLASFSAIAPSFAQAAEPSDQLRLNQIQVIGSHNSFKTKIDPNWLDLMLLVRPDAKLLDYAHPPLTEQLDLGLRSLELDLFHDPEGGRYANPLGSTLVKMNGQEPLPFDPQGKMLEPGFKVLHIQDIDFRSNCLTLADALGELRDWSDRHPRHLPVLITFNLTDSTIDLPNSVKPLPFDKEALDTLDKDFLHLLGKKKILTPDEVRGEYETLEAAVLDSHWPTLADARGRFLLVLDDAGHKKQLYLDDHPSLRGRVMFVNSRPGDAEAAVMIRNNPVSDAEKITQLVRQGYIVRTRSDAETHEARSGDYRRFEAAKQSGAQVISTDYYLADPRMNPDFQIRFDEGRCSRMNPVTGPTGATAISLE